MAADARDDVSVSLYSEDAEESANGEALEDWTYKVGSLLKTSCERDEDVDGHPTYRMQCRVGHFKWTVPSLRFFKWTAFEARVAAAESLVPDAADFPFPQRLRRQAFGIRGPWAGPDSACASRA